MFQGAVPTVFHKKNKINASLHGYSIQFTLKGIILLPHSGQLQEQSWIWALGGLQHHPVSLAPKLAVWEAASWWQQGIGPVLALLQQMVYHNSVDAVFNKVVEVLLPFLRTKRKKKYIYDVAK